MCTLDLTNKEVLYIDIENICENADKLLVKDLSDLGQSTQQKFVIFYRKRYKI